MKLRLALALLALASPAFAQSLPTPNLGTGTKLDGTTIKDTATKSQGTSVADPGTGNLEMLLPVQTFTAASHAFVAADLYKETRRSNAGSAMSDTFPAAGTTGLVNGARMFVNNADTTASLTITAGSGTTVNGAATAAVGPARSSYWIYDASATNWRPTGNSLTALLCASSGVSGLVKGNGLAACTAAVAGTDYAPATSGSAILKGNGAGGFSSAVSGTDYAPAPSGSAIQKGNGAGGFSAAVAGTDYVAPGGSAGAIDVTTQAVDNNTTKAASTAFVLGQAASATPLVNGVAAAGTSTRYARADHIHPSDTTRVPTSRTITAGAGLTGGGDLSADRTLSMSAGQLPGTITNDGASAGNVGEYIFSDVNAAGVSLSNDVSANLTSVSLTAGDWEASCQPMFRFGTSTSMTRVWTSINTTSATADGNPGGYLQWAGSITMSADDFAWPYTPKRVLLSATTTTYCVVHAVFSGGTLSVWGRLRARRVR